MSAPRSDTATVEARRNRLCELLADGKSEAEAAEILRQEGYPACVKTIQRDVTKLVPQWKAANAEAYEDVLARQQEELRDMRVTLTDVSFSPKERIILALQILDREMDLWGTKAPTKSIHASVGQGHQLDERYLAIRKLLLDEDDATCREALELVRNWLEQRKGSRLLGG